MIVMSDILKMFNTIIKNLFKKSACDMYPVKQPQIYEQTRGHIAIDAPKCILCTLCDKRCPTGAIAVNKEARTWAITRGQCILCDQCVAVCPKKCLRMDNQYATPVAKRQVETIDIPVAE